MVGFALLLLAHSGCALPLARETYPVFWNAYENLGPGFYVYSYDDLSFREPVVHMRRSGAIDSIRLALYLINRTGTELFIAGMGADPEIIAQCKVISVASSGTRESLSSLGRGEGGGVMHYFRLLNEHEAIGRRPSGTYCLSLVSGRIFVALQPGAAYDEVTIEIPLVYYTIGARDPKRVVIKKAMRIVWDSPAVTELPESDPVP